MTVPSAVCARQWRTGEKAAILRERQQVRGVGAKTSLLSQPLPALRRDLRLARREAPDGEEFILQDPAGRLFFRLGPREYAVARLLNGRRSAADIAAELKRLLPEEPIAAEEIAAFAQRLAVAGILRLPGSAEMQRLELARRRHWTAVAANWAGRVFYFRIPLGNPDRAVAWLARRLSWLYGPAVLWAAVMLVVVTALALVWRIDLLTSPQVELLSPHGLLWLLAALVGVKVVHELAHAVTCRRFGGKVPEVGLAFIVLAPCLYCDVSEAWMMPERRRRMAVTAAGMAVELVMAAVAGWLFLLTRPGWLHQLSFSLLVAASVQTLLLNGNPLLRFDGYYLLSDALELPNLRLRARDYLMSLLRRMVWGGRTDDGEAPPSRHRVLLAVYAVASYVYGWVILYAILGLIYWKLEPWGLQSVAAALIAVTVTMQIGFPAVLAVRQLGRLLRQRGNVWRFARACGIGGIAVLVVAAVLAIPVDEQVTRSCVLEAAAAQEIRVEQAGRIVRVLRKEGESVRVGELLIELADEQLAHEVAQAAEAVREAEAWCDAAQRHGPLAMADARRELAEALAEESAAKERLAALQVRAPRDGVLLRMPGAEMVGLRVPAGRVLGQVGPGDQLRAALQLTAADARRVPAGASAELRLQVAPQLSVPGRVTGNAWQASREIHPAHTVAQGGEVGLPTAGAGGSPAGADGLGEKRYRADIVLFAAPPAARPGMSGKARIYLGRTTVGGLLWQAIVNELSLDLLLP